MVLCSSLSPWICSNSCPLSQWCYPTRSSSVAPFSQEVTTVYNFLFIILININTYIGIFSPPHTDGLVLHIIFCFHCLLNEQYLEDFFHMPWVTLPCSFSQMHRNPLYCVTVYITASNWWMFISNLQYFKYYNEYFHVWMSFCTFVQDSYSINSCWMKE